MRALRIILPVMLFLFTASLVVVADYVTQSVRLGLGFGEMSLDAYVTTFQDRVEATREDPLEAEVKRALDEVADDLPPGVALPSSQAINTMTAAARAQMERVEAQLQSRVSAGGSAALAVPAAQAAIAPVQAATAEAPAPEEEALPEVRVNRLVAVGRKTASGCGGGSFCRVGGD